MIDNINQFNPVASIWDGISGVFTGTDRFGNPMNAGDIGVEALSIIPIGKGAKFGGKIFSKVAAKTGSYKRLGNEKTFF